MMEDSSKLWDDCLRMIRDKYGEKYQHWFDVWYGDVRFESYDPESHTLLIQVPSRYVYEFLETNGAKDIRWATTEMFGGSVVLQYRIVEQRQEPDFAELADYLKRQGCLTDAKIPHFQIVDAEKRLRDGLRYFLGDGYQWLPAYDQVAAWLSDNKGRGLICLGTSGLGKTELCTRILPVILGFKSIRICNATDITAKGALDELRKAKVIVIDGLGTESVETNFFGERHRPFFELCDVAERQGKLLIVTTNLSTTPVSEQNRHQYPCSIAERYGTDVISRLRATVKTIVFTGQDFRK